MTNLKAQFLSLALGATGAAIILAAGSATADTTVDSLVPRQLDSISSQEAAFISTDVPLGACFNYTKDETGNFNRLYANLKAKKDSINIRYVHCSMRPKADCKVGTARVKSIYPEFYQWFSDVTCAEHTFSAFLYKNNSGHDTEIQTITTKDPVPKDYNKLNFGANAIKLPIGGAEAFTSKLDLTYFGAHMVKSDWYEDLEIIKALPRSGGVKISSPMPADKDANVIDYLSKRLAAYLKANMVATPPLTANSRAKPYEDIGFTSIDIKDPTAIKWACVREAVVSMKNAKTGFLSFEGTDLKSFLGLSSEKDVGSPIVPRDCLALSVKNKKTTIARPEN